MKVQLNASVVSEVIIILILLSNHKRMYVSNLVDNNDCAK